MNHPDEAEVLDLLSDPTCLQVIRSLQSNGGRIELSSLMEVLSGSQSFPRELTKAKSGLEHARLRMRISRMERLGILRYDARQRILALRELPSSVATQLESMLLLLFDVLRGSKAA